jgi:hypothetical protein
VVRVKERRWSGRRIKGMAGLGRMTARLGALVARIDRAFHGLESHDVVGDQDLMDIITGLVDSSDAAANLARVNKMNRGLVRNHYALYTRLCRFMNTLVDKTAANASDRNIDVCCVGKGKYLMRLTDQTAMGYVVVEKAGATVTTLRWLRGYDGEGFRMHAYANVCVDIRVRISDIDVLRSNLAAWGRTKRWFPDVNSEVEMEAEDYMRTRSGIVFRDAPARPFGLNIWINENHQCLFEYSPDTPTLVRGIIRRRGATALVWGFAERKGGPSSVRIICYSMRDNIRSSQELYAFITTHEWTNPATVVFEHAVDVEEVEFKRG